MNKTLIAVATVASAFNITKSEAHTRLCIVYARSQKDGSKKSYTQLAEESVTSGLLPYAEWKNKPTKRQELIQKRRKKIQKHKEAQVYEVLREAVAKLEEIGLSHKEIEERMTSVKDRQISGLKRSSTCKRKRDMIATIKQKREELQEMESNLKILV